MLPEDDMHFQFLIEDWSGEVLIRHVMEKIKKTPKSAMIVNHLVESGVLERLRN